MHLLLNLALQQMPKIGFQLVSVWLLASEVEGYLEAGGACSTAQVSSGLKSQGQGQNSFLCLEVPTPSKGRVEPPGPSQPLAYHPTTLLDPVCLSHVEWWHLPTKLSLSTGSGGRVCSEWLLQVRQQQLCPRRLTGTF